MAAGQLIASLISLVGEPQFLKDAEGLLLFLFGIDARNTAKNRLLAQAAVERVFNNAQPVDQIVVLKDHCGLGADGPQLFFAGFCDVLSI